MASEEEHDLNLHDLLGLTKRRPKLVKAGYAYVQEKRAKDDHDVLYCLWKRSMTIWFFPSSLNFSVPFVPVPRTHLVVDILDLFSLLFCQSYVGSP